MADAFFLHYAAQGEFHRGIFAPYATQEEAERQAAWTIANGADKEIVEQVFRAPYVPPPKFGWTRETLTRPEPHLDESKWERVATQKQVWSRVNKWTQAILGEIAQAEADDVRVQHERVLRGADIKNSVPGNAYTWNTGGTATAVPAALTAATAKTIVLISAATANQPSLVEIGISFDGVTSSAIPVLCELVSGTGGTAGTPRAALAAGHQLRGWPAQASQTTCADTYSAEPGTQLVAKKWYLSPNGGSMVLPMPLGREPTGLVTATTDAKTWSIRLTAPAAVNAHAYIEYEE